MHSCLDTDIDRLFQNCMTLTKLFGAKVNSLKRPISTQSELILMSSECIGLINLFKSLFYRVMSWLMFGAKAN